MFKKLFLIIVFLLGIFVFGLVNNVWAKTSETTDLSGKEIKAMTVYEVAEFFGVSAEDYALKLSDHLETKIKNTDSIQLLHDNLGLEPDSAKDLAKSLQEQSDNKSVQFIEESSTKKNDFKENYYFLEITLITLFFYSLTWALAKIGKIKLILHRKIWNWVLLLSFVPAGILGLLIAIRLSFGFGFNFPFSINYWHTVGGIAMAEIAILHIMWHIKYYFSFKKMKGFYDEK